MDSKLILLEYEDDYDLLSPLCLIPNCAPSNKELRLALDLIDIIEPLFKRLPIEDKVDTLKDVFKISTTKNKLQKLKSHKDFLYKYVVTIKNNKVITKRVKKH